MGTPADDTIWAWAAERSARFQLPSRWFQGTVEKEKLFLKKGMRVCAYFLGSSFLPPPPPSCGCAQDAAAALECLKGSERISRHTQDNRPLSKGERATCHITYSKSVEKSPFAAALLRLRLLPPLSLGPLISRLFRLTGCKEKSLDLGVNGNVSVYLINSYLFSRHRLPMSPCLNSIFLAVGHI